MPTATSAPRQTEALKRAVPRAYCPPQDATIASAESLNARLTGALEVQALRLKPPKQPMR